MNITELKKELGFKSKYELDVYIAELFSFKTVGAYQNSSAKQRYENALCKFYEFLREGKKESQNPTDVDTRAED